jgi:hypothetical protein
MNCVHCKTQVDAKATKAGNERLPRGWKRHNGQASCAKCWSERFILRAVTIPVAGPVDAEWPALRDSLREAWGQAGAVANWVVSELYARDARRTPDVAKLPKMPTSYLYPEIRRRFPDFPAGSIPTIEHAVTGKYRSTRYEVLWTGEAVLPTFRYPYPWPVRSADWKATFGTDNVPLVACGIAGKRFTLRLRGGHDYRRQLSAFRKIVNGEAVQGELALYRVRANGGDHRNGDIEKTAGGGQDVHTRIMAKLVAWLPREQREAGENTMLVRTDPNAVLVAEVDGRDPWILNADYVRRWIAEHRVYLQRISEDTKREKRYPADKRRQINEAREKRCHKQNNRLDSFCHETAAMLAKYAARCRVGQVIYDDACKSYFESFPWFKLKQLIHEKLGALSIEVLGETDALTTQGV